METKEEKWCVYIHKSPSNKAYIGITSKTPQKRWGVNGYGYRNQPYFYNAIKKYGWDNFAHIIWTDGLNQEDAIKIEILLIALFDTTNTKNGYNISRGGDGGKGIKKIRRN